MPISPNPPLPNASSFGAADVDDAVEVDQVACAEWLTDADVFATFYEWASEDDEIAFRGI